MSKNQVKNNLASLLDDLPQLNTPSNKNYHYKPNKKVVAAYSISSVLVEKIERMAYWEHLNKSTIVEAVLNKYFAEKDFESLPTQRTII